MDIVDKIIYLRNIKHDHDTFRIYKNNINSGGAKEYEVYLGKTQSFGLYVYYYNGKYEIESIQKEVIIDEINKVFIKHRQEKIKNILSDG